MSYITTTLDNLIHQTAFFNITLGNLLMIAVACVFLYLAIAKGFEPLLLVMMMVCAVAGATAGRALSKKMDEHKVDVMFMGMLILITAISIYNCFKYAS